MGLFKKFAVNKILQKAEGRLPKLISPEAHGAIDYAHVAVFLGASVYFWNRDRRAAVTSLATAGFIFAQSMLTAYPLGIKPVISFPVHGKLDRGFVGFAASAPKTLEFKTQEAAKFYRASAVLDGIVVSLTDWDGAAPKLLSASATARA